MPTTIAAGDSTNGVTITPSNDNALTLQTGPAGSKVNAVAFASDGTATMLQQPKLAASAVVSMVRLNTANGYGSTNTAIRRFSTVVTNVGSDITYADSATLGASFTINTAGVYSISYTEQFNASGDIGISLNSTQLSTSPNSITAADRLVVGQTGGVNQAQTVSTALYLASGAVIRPHSGVPSGSQPSLAQFTITRVA
jgi:hypothetical protein